MAGHALTTSTTTARVRTIGSLALAVAQLLALRMAVADDCPETSSELADEPAVSVPPASPDDPIQFEAEGLEATKDGEWLLQGEVTITRGPSRLVTRDARFNPETQNFKVEDGVTFTNPTLTVKAQGAEIDPAGAATFDEAEFELPMRNARGGADRIRATASGLLQLDNVRYTTCPLGNDDWSIRASDIDIDQPQGLGTGRGVRLDFKGVPIIYAPIFSFPIGNERKSGFLYPTLDTSGRSGTGLTVPWYWNIAPNYDATFEPTYYSKRGAKLDTEFRYLTGIGRGTLDAEYLYDDQEFGDSRSLLRYSDQSDLGRHLRLAIDAANVSDSEWFEDFGSGPEGTSTLYLNRSADLIYMTDHWHAVARVQNFQTIADDTIPPRSRPYTLLPQLAVSGTWPDLPYGLTLGFDMEVANFEHNLNDELQPLPEGVRFDAAPEVRMPLRGAGIYLEPVASWRYTSYELADDLPPGQDDSPSRSAPVLSVDGGMIFERDSGSRQQRVQTLEPRFMYLYTPYRNQDQLPVFDTVAADLNMVQLFRTNRYVGADRLSNANQVTVGVTSRLLDADTGQQFLSATVGQSYYFDAPRVALPGEVLDDTETSDVVAELDLKAFSDWNVRMGLQWDPGETRSEKGDVYFRYQAGHRPRPESWLPFSARCHRAGGRVRRLASQRQVERLRPPRVFAR